MIEEDNKIRITTAFSDAPQNINNFGLLALDSEPLDDYNKEIYSILIKMLDASLKTGNIDRLEADLQEVKTRYERSDSISRAVDMKIQEVQYVLMCKYLESKNLEKARTFCERFDDHMEEYIVSRIRLGGIPNIIESNNFYAAMLKIDISQKVNLEVRKLKFWEGILNIEKPSSNYRLPKEWQPNNKSLMVRPNGFMGLSMNSYSYFGFVKVFKIRYDPKSQKNKMNLGDVQKLKEYLIRPRVTKNIRIVFEEGIEDVVLDLNNVNVLCRFSIKLPSTAKTFGGNLFSNNVNVSRVDLSNTQIESIGDSTFINSNVEKIIVPSCLKQIGNHAFANCYYLKKLDLSYTGITMINRSAFYNSGLKSIKLSKTINKMDLEALSKCKNLSYIDLSKTSIEKIDSGFLASSGVSKIKLPRNINELDFGAFSDCQNLKEIDLSNTKLRKIGAYAFFNSNIKSIKLPATVESIDYEAFGNCKKLRRIDFSNTNLEKVAPYAFYGSGVNEVKLPDTVKEVSSTSFKECDNLKKINLRKDIIK